MIVIVTVTRDDVARGIPGNGCACPVWFAIARALPRLGDSFSVGPLGVCTGLTSWRLPDAARRFMDAFDDGWPVKPFEFTLDVPAGLVPAGGEH